MGNNNLDEHLKFIIPKIINFHDVLINNKKSQFELDIKYKLDLYSRTYDYINNNSAIELIKKFGTWIYDEYPNLIADKEDYFLNINESEIFCKKFIEFYNSYKLFIWPCNIIFTCVFNCPNIINDAKKRIIRR